MENPGTQPSTGREPLHGPRLTGWPDDGFAAAELDLEALPWLATGSEPPQGASFEIDTHVFELEAIRRTCHRLTGRCHLHLVRSAAIPGNLRVTLWTDAGDGNLASLAGELCTALLEQQLRESLAREMRPVRELIVAQAFAEGNLLDPGRDMLDYDTDPLGVGICR